MTTFSRSLAFLLGFGITFLPFYGPFLGLLLFFSTRWSLRRFDVLWWGAGLLFALPLAVRGDLAGFFFGVVQVLAPWLVYRAFGQLAADGPPIGKSKLSRPIGVGLLSGLALVVLFGWLQLGALGAGLLGAVTQAFVGAAGSSLYGHTVFALGALVAILLPDMRLKLMSLGLSALGILVSGSREAALAWLLVALTLLLMGGKRSWRSRVAEVSLVSLMLLVAAGIGPQLGWGRVGLLVDLAPVTNPSVNLLQGSESPEGDWWDTLGVRAKVERVALAGQERVSYHLTKETPESWGRLQQVVPLLPNTPYTVSAWVKAPGGSSLPGIQGRGQAAAGATFTLRGFLSGDAWKTNVDGAGRVLSSGVAAEESTPEGVWRRVWVSFVYEGDEPRLLWWLGLSPDQRTTAGSEASFAGFQLERGSTLTPYTPGPVVQGFSLRNARVSYWQSAWQGFAARPVWGWGREAFSEAYRSSWPAQRRLHEVPEHAYNAFLNVLFERGLVGFCGLLLLLYALTVRAYRARDAAFLVVFAALLVANMFDTTLFYGGVLYPLAAVAGWRASSRHVPTQQEATAKQVGVRLALSVTDFFTALAAFNLAALCLWWAGRVFHFDAGTIVSPTGAIGYALLLWPLMAWREGLYPGYGLTAPQELRQQVLSAAYAGLILTASSALFSEELPIPGTVLVLTILFSAVLSPLGRTVAKYVLHHFGLWGREVVILGAGKAGRRVARALQQRPLDGLHPVALFDDDPAKRDTEIEGLRVTGTLQDAQTFARARGVRHAIVAISHASEGTLTQLLNTQGRAFKQVQFVPRIEGLPVYGVHASSLDNLLALEVDNALNSKLNQSVKRTLDLLGVTLGGVAISPFLLLLMLAIYIDSPGRVFFGHKRVGQGGEHFTTWKFRTMVPNAQEVLEEHLARDPLLAQEWQTSFKLQDDPRITRVGKFLRKTSLDELPQLWNVLVGEMSLVGPRPIIDEEVPRYHTAFELYKLVRPGMTGYWQVSGRSDTDYPHRVALDSFYIRNWSVWLDIVILMATVKVVLEGDGAY